MKKAIATALIAATALMTISCSHKEAKPKVIDLSVLSMQWTANELQNTGAAYSPIETAIMDTIWFEPKEWDDAFLAKIQKQEDQIAKELFSTDMEKTEKANEAIDSLEKIRQDYLQENRVPGGLVLQHIFKANTEKDTIYLVYDIKKMLIAGETFYLKEEM